MTRISVELDLYTEAGRTEVPVKVVVYNMLNIVNIICSINLVLIRYLFSVK